MIYNTSIINEPEKWDMAKNAVKQCIYIKYPGVHHQLSGIFLKQILHFISLMLLCLLVAGGYITFFVETAMASLIDQVHPSGFLSDRKCLLLLVIGLLFPSVACLVTIPFVLNSFKERYLSD